MSIVKLQSVAHLAIRNFCANIDSHLKKKDIKSQMQLKNKIIKTKTKFQEKIH